MTEVNISEKEIIKEVTNNVFDVLRKNGFEIKEKRSTFQNTEQLLYLMPKLSEAVNHNKARIKYLQDYGLDKKGGVVKTIVTNQVKQDESEIIDSEISILKQRNYSINSRIEWINGILQSIKSDKFYEIIELKYYQGKTYEEMAEHFSCETRTIGRNKSRLINEIKVLLFPAYSINELGC